MKAMKDEMAAAGRISPADLGLIKLSLTEGQFNDILSFVEG
jgi:hypothetical protein